jgi:uncharacterized membrane protein
MKQKTHKGTFWVILTVINIVAMIIVVTLWVHFGEDDPQAISGTVLLGIVLFLLVIDVGCLLIDYRRWCSRAHRQQQMDRRKMTNIEVIISAAGTALVMYGEDAIVSYDILCDGPNVTLQAGLATSEHVADSSWEPKR